MQSVEFLDEFLKISTDTQDYAKSFAYYMDRKTSVAREIKELLLGIFRTGALYLEDGITINQEVLPHDYWYTPMRCKLASNSDMSEYTYVTLPVITIARSVNGLIAKDSDALFSTKVQYFGADYTATIADLLDDLNYTIPDALIADGDEIFTVQLPYKVRYEVNGSSVVTNVLTIDCNTDLTTIVSREDASFSDIYINVYQTLQEMCSDVNKTTAITLLISELSNGHNLSVTDIKTKLDGIINTDSTSVLGDLSDLVTIATDTSVDHSTRITNLVSAVQSEADEVPTAINNLESSYEEVIDFGATLSNDAYTGKSLQSMWNTSTASRVFKTAFSVIKNVLVVAGKLVIAALKGLCNLGSRLWKRFIEPTYISKDFVKSGDDTRENHCDVPFASIGNAEGGVPYNPGIIAQLLAQMLQESSQTTYDLTNLKYTIRAGLYTEPTAAADDMSFACRVVDSAESQWVQSGPPVQKASILSKKWVKSIDNVYRTHAEAKELFGDLAVNDYSYRIIDPNGAILFSEPDKPAVGALSFHAVATMWVDHPYDVQNLYFSNNGNASGSSVEVKVVSETDSGIIVQCKCGGYSYVSQEIMSYYIPFKFKRVFVTNEYGMSDFFVEPMYTYSVNQPSSGNLKLHLKTGLHINHAGGVSPLVCVVNVETEDNQLIKIKVQTNGSNNMVRFEEWTTTYEDVSYTFTDARLTKTEITESYPMRSISIGGISMIFNTYAAAQHYFTREAKFSTRFDLHIPWYGCWIDNDQIKDAFNNTICTVTRGPKQPKFEQFGVEDIASGVDLSSDFNTGLSLPLKSYVYRMNLAIDVTFTRDSALEYTFMYGIETDCTEGLSFSRVTTHKDEAAYLDVEDVYYDTNPITKHIEWFSDNCLVNVYSRSGDTFSPEILEAITKDINNPLDYGCACVSRYKFAVIQILSGRDDSNVPQLYPQIYGCPISHKYLFTDDLKCRYFRLDGSIVYENSDGTFTSFTDDGDLEKHILQTLTKCYLPTTDYSIEGEDGDCRAFKDMYAAKYVTDFYAWLLVHPNENVSLFFNYDRYYDNHWFIFGSTIRNPMTDENGKLVYNNVSFRNMCYDAGVNEDNFPMWLYAYMTKIISNKPAYLKLWYLIHGDAPTFFPYLIGDRVGSPKWHISTDDELQNAMDILCTAIIVAACVVVAVIILGVVAKKITKALTMKMESRAQEEQVLRLQTQQKRGQRNALTAQRDELKKRMKGLDPKSEEYTALKGQLDGVEGELKTVVADIAKGSKDLFKQQKITKRWNKLATLFGAATSSSDKVSDALSDYSPGEEEAMDNLETVDDVVSIDLASEGVLMRDDVLMITDPLTGALDGFRDLVTEKLSSMKSQPVKVHIDR